MKILDQDAHLIIEVLINNGFEAYYVGGCVRTIVHNTTHNDNLPIKDFDIVTNASYEDMKKLFNHIEDRGESFNVSIVKINNKEYEVACYRGEKYPEGGSTRPNEIFDVDTLDEDLLRRDFKMNSLVIDYEGVTLDHIGGLEDIQNKLISTIGDPNERFSEDPLRIIRAIRFVSQLDYSIEENTFKAMCSNSYLLASIPQSRIEGEFSKIISGRNPIEALLYLKEIHSFNGEIPFKNTILNVKTSLLNSIFSLSFSEFYKVVKKINSDTGYVGFFYSLYRHFNVDVAEEELTNMQITNNKVINDVKLLVENKNIIFNQTAENLLELVKHIKGQNGRETLLEILDIYSKVDEVNFFELRGYIKRPLFINELPYDGRDIMEEGEKLGYRIQGKLIGEILDLGRKKSVLGEDYSLSCIFNELKDKLEAA